MQFKNTSRIKYFIEVIKLDKTKTSEKVDTPIRVIKKNIVIFVDFLCTSIKSVIKSASFPSSLKLAEVTLLRKIEKKDMKKKL